MGSDASRLHPAHGQWFADLEKTAGLKDDPFVGQDLNEVGDVHLEVSRASTRMRGGLLPFALLVLSGQLFMATMFLSELSKTLRQVPSGTLLLMLVVFVGSIALGVWGIRVELRTPQDEPIRFNRKTGMVYVSSFKSTQNPFGKWSSEVKVYNWADLHGELIRYTQFNSRFFVIRYGLELAACKPGTFEVVERFWVERNQPMPDLLRGKWAYICAYMSGTPLDQLPPAMPRDQKVSLSNSFKTWLPWLHDWRGYLEHPMLTFMALLMLPFTPLFLVFAAAHYIAMRFAPPVSWPADIDREPRVDVWRRVARACVDLDQSRADAERLITAASSSPGCPCRPRLRETPVASRRPVLLMGARSRRR
jgi:hypothetical protein